MFCLATSRHFRPLKILQFEADTEASVLSDLMVNGDLDVKDLA